MDFELPESHRLLRETVREFALREVKPRARDWDREERFPIEIMPKLGELGLLGIKIPEVYGGAGLDMLAYAKRIRPHTPTKSGLMLGLGETLDEVKQVMRDLRAHQVDILTLGQYLRPSAKHLPIIRYVSMEEFADLKREGYALGFSHVESGPLVRSSYHARDAVEPVPTL